MSGAPTRPPAPGDAAPELELPLLDGGSIALTELGGHVTLVTFLRHAG